MVLFIFFMVVTTSIYLRGIYAVNIFADKPTTKSDTTDDADLIVNGGETDEEENDCNVMGLNLRGELVTYKLEQTDTLTGMGETDMTASENIMLAIESAEADDDIKAIILEIDSYGGSPVAGEEVAAALKYSTKPTVALIRGAGASAAYMAASGADTIFASKFSDVGGIGVTISYTDNVLKNLKDGYTFHQLSTGKFKDTGNPDKTFTDEEKAMIMADLNVVHNDFVKLISDNRQIDLAVVTKMADGSTILGQKALENKLIDQVGNYFDVLQFVSSTIGTTPEVCWY